MKEIEEVKFRFRTTLIVKLKSIILLLTPLQHPVLIKDGNSLESAVY